MGHSARLKYSETRWLENHMDWAISSEAPNRRTFNDYPGSGSKGKRSETGNPKPHSCGMVKI